MEHPPLMGPSNGMRIRGVSLYYLPIETRMPLKFGTEVLTEVVVARARLLVSNAQGEMHEGWGETPLSVQWTWPGTSPNQERLRAMQSFCHMLAEEWLKVEESGDPLELGWQFQEHLLKPLWEHFNRSQRQGLEPMPWLAGLICLSLFDIALHDAFGHCNHLPTYECYSSQHLSHDLSRYLQPAPSFTGSPFTETFPADYLLKEAPRTLCAWHLVGGLDPLEAQDLTGEEPEDGHPVLLEDWIKRDQLQCLKIKLRGNDAEWDYDRCIRVGQISIRHGLRWLTADFNCTVTEPDYVNLILDRLRDSHPRVYGMLLYVEQPFPYELAEHPIDVHSVSARKPLYLDESAHDWKLVARGRELGWSGVALKTCKTQTGALLSACWAKAHGMGLMVQDLTNPMLAQIPHVQLAARVGTIMGVETNAMQFYPDASGPEATVHPGLYQRKRGCLELSTLEGHGFGYRLEDIQRQLPEPALDLRP